MRKQYCVTLSLQESQALLNLLATGKESAQKMAPTRILLKADQAPSGSAWPNNRIDEALEASVAIV